MTIPTLPPPHAVMPPGGACHFKLKDSYEYRFWRRGRPVELKKGQVFSTNNREDIDYFRARPDVIGECDPLGNFIGVARDGEIDPKKAKSYRTYGHRPPGVSGAPPSMIHVGAQTAQAPAPPVLAAVTPTGPMVLPPPPAPVAKSDSLVPPAPPIPPGRQSRRGDRARQIVEQQAAEQAAMPMTPIERIANDGTVESKTQVRR